VTHPLRNVLVDAVRTDLTTFVHRAVPTVHPGIRYQPG
jgi:hypothetical protein